MNEFNNTEQINEEQLTSPDTAAPERNPALAKAALSFGIASFILGIFYGILGLIVSVAAMVCGIIGTKKFPGNKMVLAGMIFGGGSFVSSIYVVFHQFF